ncbi:hypothetical protein [uncultured Algimonas sp.]|uniref:hypothetical protein n=1 Tax=uncultured Algimonas sp. TaxID=1547920 RepID=UPI0026068760|nr:hypothetical protein [uncultured Algimonas sp.]
MIEGFDWQPVLIAAIAVLSMVNGLSVLQNYRADRADIRIAPVFDDDWMFWSELVDETAPEPIRRYVAIGYLARTNFGRRTTSIADTQLKLRLRNRKTVQSFLFDVSPPETVISNADSRPLPVIKPGPDPFDFRPLLQPGQASAGIHCFLFGTYGSDEWSPKTQEGRLTATVELENGFGQCFRSDVVFRHVAFADLEALFPSLKGFMIKNLEVGES